MLFHTAYSNITNKKITLDYHVKEVIIWF